MSEEKSKAKEQTPANDKQEQAEDKPKQPVHLPLLLDFTLSVAKVTVALIGALTAVLSTIAGASVVITVLRSGAAMLAVGLMFWLVNWIIAHNFLEITQKELAHELEAVQDRAHSTVEKSA